MVKKPQRRTRIEHLYGTTAGDVKEIGVTFDERTGEIQFANAMVDTYSEVSYERPKGPKVISRIPQASTTLTFHNSIALSSNYDFLCAVDTNTRIINQRKISAVGFVTFSKAPPPQGTGDYWSLDVPFCWEFVNIKVENPENFGWLVALETIYFRRLITNEMRIGMVVDSDLGNLIAYNARRKPFFENRLLPKNVQLIYASADTGGENIINKVLKIADSVSGQILHAVETGKVTPNLEVANSPYFEGQRIVMPSLKRY
ncbi:hypothetical protein [Ancylobacter polymorphus]|uniref:Uncharacterized protein n=1 Tax=Ancylobacter polymorphus TaxID=223390 RepID=A0A9E7A123_9HYPH|nr:hypothetical protein [Ancylobacter polymorphus]UOK72525.1 hypothetical protein K9D25_07430 [Ancylobacter polymorphus]